MAGVQSIGTARIGPGYPLRGKWEREMQGFIAVFTVLRLPRRWRCPMKPQRSRRAEHQDRGRVTSAERRYSWRDRPSARAVTRTCGSITISAQRGVRHCWCRHSQRCFEHSRRFRLVNPAFGSWRRSPHYSWCFCCKRGYAAVTGSLAVQPFDILHEYASGLHASECPSRFTSARFCDEPSWIMRARDEGLAGVRWLERDYGC